MHLRRELEALKKKVLTLGALVEETYRQAIMALTRPDPAGTAKIREADDPIDFMETEVEEESLKILALHQPVAADLRYIVSVLKFASDLERIGDLAVHIAKKSLHFNPDCPEQVTQELTAMARQAEVMLAQAMTALINIDMELAKRVRAMDDEVDELKKAVRIKMEAALQHDPANCRAYLAALGAARNIERIADLAANICVDVIYSASGQLVRHVMHD